MALARISCNKVFRGTISQMSLNHRYAHAIKAQALYSTTTQDERTNAGSAAGGTVISERRGVVMLIGINRPEVRNAVNQETAHRLTEELSAFDQDNNLKVAVLHGVGGNFCAGYDLKELAQSAGSLKLEQDVCRGPGPMGPSRLRLSKPLIAAVSGFAVAGGLELALLADLRVVEESSVMGVFCRRFALQVALELAEQVSSFPQRCLRADRNSAYHAVFDATSFTQAMQYEMDHGIPVIQAEAITGATKFSSGTGRGGTFTSSKL
nr:enoyl-CoA hydratase EchA19 isoform X3 [Misgurnus anguillicaudatus]